MSEIIICLIGVVICLIGLYWIRTSESRSKITQPPKGWVQSKGVRRKMYKPKNNN